MKPKLRL